MSTHPFTADDVERFRNKVSFFIWLKTDQLLHEEADRMAGFYCEDVDQWIAWEWTDSDGDDDWRDDPMMWHQSPDGTTWHLELERILESRPEAEQWADRERDRLRFPTLDDWLKADRFDDLYYLGDAGGTGRIDPAEREAFHSRRRQRLRS